MRRFVSRPDLTPPAVSIVTDPAFGQIAGSPPYLFSAPRPPLATQGTQGLMIVDLSGELVWFRPTPGAHQIPFCFRAQIYNGKPVLTWFAGSVTDGHGVGKYYIADDTYGNEIVVAAKNGLQGDLHEFLLTPDGGALFTAYQSTNAYYGRTLLNGIAQEVDVATGAVIHQWASLPEVNPSQSYGGGGDYFHINSIDVWPNSNYWLISARNTWTVYLVDPTQTGDSSIIWRIGGKQPSFTMGSGTNFEYQHDARALPDGSGISLFDDGSQPNPYDKSSWGKVFYVNMSNKTVTLSHEFAHSTSHIDTPREGNNEVLANGGSFVGWGSAPYFSEFAPPGDVVVPPMILDGRFPGQTSTYRAFMLDWTGNPPTTELRLVVLPHPASSSSWIAFVSWNGATEVAAWGLYIDSSLQTIVPRTGFETAIPVRAAGTPTFQVQAFNAQGTVVGTSPSVAPT